jgi:dihydrofolate reductase
MRKLIVTEYVTLDGVMEDPGGGGWSNPFWSDEAGMFKFDELFGSDALLLGRVTYAGFAKAWPTMKDEAGFSDRMNGMRKYVVAAGVPQPEWNNTRVITGKVAEEVIKLKQEAGQAILVAGSSQLVQALREHDLVDEYRLMVHPIIVGKGKRLFPEGQGSTRLNLVETKTFPKGIVVLTYTPERQAKA